MFLFNLFRINKYRKKVNNFIEELKKAFIVNRVNIDFFHKMISYYDSKDYKKIEKLLIKYKDISDFVFFVYDEKLSTDIAEYVLNNEEYDINDIISVISKSNACTIKESAYGLEQETYYTIFSTDTLEDVNTILETVNKYEEKNEILNISFRALDNEFNNKLFMTYLYNEYVNKYDGNKLFISFSKMSNIIFKYINLLDNNKVKLVIDSYAASLEIPKCYDSIKRFDLIALYNRVVSCESASYIESLFQFNKCILTNSCINYYGLFVTISGIDVSCEDVKMDIEDYSIERVIKCALLVKNLDMNEYEDEDEIIKTIYTIFDSHTNIYEEQDCNCDFCLKKADSENVHDRSKELYTVEEEKSLISSLSELDSKTDKKYKTLKRKPFVKNPIEYKCTYSNADMKLDEIMKKMKNNNDVRILLYGVSGSGKTMFAKELGKKLGMSVKIIKASDINSKWVGESEQNISNLFKNIDIENEIILIDEIDTFLRSKDDINSDHNTTVVNEFLTQLDEFEGIFIGTTNRKESLESAFERRFDLKIKFDFMDSKHSIKLVKNYLKYMNIKIDNKELNRLNTIKNTPGIVNNIYRKSRFQNIRDTKTFVDNIEKEYKELVRDKSIYDSDGKTLGFNLCQ